MKFTTMTLTFKLYLLTVLSTLLSAGFITLSFINLFFSQTSLDLNKAEVQIQVMRIAVAIVTSIGCFLFFYAGNGVHPKLLITSNAFCCISWLSQNFLTTHSFVIQFYPSVWNQLQIHPIIAALMCTAGTILCLSRCHVIVLLCWKHKMCGFRVRETVCGITIRALLTCIVVYTLMLPAFSIWSVIDVLLNPGIWKKFVTETWYTLASTSFLLISTLQSVFMSYFLIMGLKKKSRIHLKRFYLTMFVFIILYTFSKTTLVVMDNEVLSPSWKDLIFFYMVQITGMIYIMASFVLSFLYRKFLKHNEKNVGKFDPIVEAGRKLLNIRTVNVGNITVSREQIGSGFSSTVYAGTLTKYKFCRKKLKPVAIKVITRSENPELHPVIYEELRNVHRVIKHSNLVNFIGTCLLSQDDIQKPLGSVNILMELCEKGSLDKFLQNLQHPLYTQRSDSSGKILTQLWSWSLEVATGMEYLASQKLVHGDLSVRNILLNSSLVAKISDFGMSRKLYEYQEYARNTEQSKFPWKSMAPESLDELKFSLESDVYSYGVLVWEIYNLGETPWPEMCWTSNFVTELKAGKRLERPILVPQFIYAQVMERCWKIDPKERPTFSQICRLIKANFDNLENDGKSKSLIEA